MLVATMLEKMSYSSSRYECLPGCLETHGKVVGTGYYDMVTEDFIIDQHLIRSDQLFSFLEFKVLPLRIETHRVEFPKLCR